jgi:deoxycytidylate deaminase
MWADPARLRGSVLYCTLEPCDGCARMISGTGISRVVFAVSLAERRMAGR